MINMCLCVSLCAGLDRDERERQVKTCIVCCLMMIEIVTSDHGSIDDRLDFCCPQDEFWFNVDLNAADYSSSCHWHMIIITIIIMESKQQISPLSAD